MFMTSSCFRNWRRWRCCLDSFSTSHLRCVHSFLDFLLFFYLSHTHIFCLEFGLKLIPPFFVAVSSLPREVTLYKRKVSMSRKVKKSNKANFSFGNDEIVMRSSYTYDFNSLRAVHPIRDRRLDVPKGAQVSIMTKEHLWLLSSNSNGWTKHDWSHCLP